MYGVFEYSNSPSRRLRPEEVHEVISTIADHNPTTHYSNTHIPTTLLQNRNNHGPRQLILIPI